MELSELSSSSRDPDVTGARARCVGGRAPGGVVRGMGGGGRRGLRRCSAAWMAARAVGDRFSSTGAAAPFGRRQPARDVLLVVREGHHVGVAF